MPSSLATKAKIKTKITTATTTKTAKRKKPRRMGRGEDFGEREDFKLVFKSTMYMKKIPTFRF